MSLPKRLRYNLRLFTGLISKYRILIILCVVIGALISLTTPKLLSLIPNKPEDQNIGLIGQFSPQNLPIEVTSLVSQGLTQNSPDGTPQAAIAKSWEASDDSKVFRFTLNSGLKWHDNTPLTAADVSFAFKDVEIHPISDDVIEFRLKDSYVPFPSTLTRPLLKEKNIGVGGNYKFSKINTSGKFVSEILLNPVKDSLPKITFRFYPTEDLAISAFKIGDINEIRDLSTPPEIAKWPGVYIQTIPRLERYVALLFNTQKDPFTEKEIRQALAYGIDKSGYESRAVSPISPQSWAFNNQVKPYEKDFDKAKGIIKSSKLEGKEIELSVFSWLLPNAEKIKSEWEEMGLKINLKVVSSIPDEFDVLLAAQKIPNDPDQYSLWHSTQSTNFTRLKNPKIDKLLEDGRKTEDKESRLKIYLDFQRFLAEESPAIFLYHPNSYTVARN